MPEHVAITDPDIHEPKGITGASAGQVYVANGIGSGAWGAAAIEGQTAAVEGDIPVSDGLGNIAFRELVLSGWWDYEHAGTTQAITASTFTDMIIDGAGINTKDTYKLPSAGDIWDTTNNQFDWVAGGCELGDTVDIRVDINVTTASPGTVIRQFIDMAHGSASEYRIQYDSLYAKDASTFQRTILTSVYMGNADTLNFPAKLVFWADGGATLDVNGVYVRVYPRNPRFV